MLDCQLFGLKPWGHHLTSVLLHAVNTVLIFLLLYRLTSHRGNGPLLSSSLSPQLDTGSKTTAAIASARQAGAMWRSAAVAALFAVHPLHVESVAWVAERKDVLSTFFFLLTLLFYARFARGIKSGSNGQVASEAAIEDANQRPSSIFHLPSSSSYYLALMFFGLGLMSKPMLVTVPFVLLLLDYWPLKRFDEFTIHDFTIHNSSDSGKSAVFRVERQCERRDLRGAAARWGCDFGESLPLGARIGNALISYCRYLGKLFWPTDLAVFYPHPGHWPVGQVAAGGRVAPGHYGAVYCGAGAISVFADGLAVVCRDAGASDWVGASGRSGDGGPVHLYSIAWGADPGNLGWVRTDPALAVSGDGVVGGGWCGDRPVPRD